MSNLSQSPLFVAGEAVGLTLGAALGLALGLWLVLGVALGVALGLWLVLGVALGLTFGVLLDDAPGVALGDGDAAGLADVEGEGLDGTAADLEDALMKAACFLVFNTTVKESPAFRSANTALLESRKTQVASARGYTFCPPSADNVNLPSASDTNVPVTSLEGEFPAWFAKATAPKDKTKTHRHTVIMYVSFFFIG
jgi:hypothetical protein